MLYSTENDTDPIDTVVLDVTPAEAFIIDSELGVAVRQISKFTRRGQITVLEKHRYQIMDKLGIHNVAGLTRYALSTGMIEIQPRCS